VSKMRVEKFLNLHIMIIVVLGAIINADVSKVHKIISYIFIMDKFLMTVDNKKIFPTYRTSIYAASSY
jgi:hypothetical protein